MTTRFSVVYVQRAKQRVPDPPADLKLPGGDIVVVVGQPEKVRFAFWLFKDSATD